MPTERLPGKWHIADRLGGSVCSSKGSPIFAWRCVDVALFNTIKDEVKCVRCDRILQAITTSRWEAIVKPEQENIDAH
jgi:hypothetical protein